jgi:hypothetical protein
MWTRDLQLLVELEIMDPRANSDEAFFVWVELMRDPAVEPGSRAYYDSRPKPTHDQIWGFAPMDYGQPYDGVHAAVAAMKPAERLALGERVRIAYAESLKRPGVA